MSYSAVNIIISCENDSLEKSIKEVFDKNHLCHVIEALNLNKYKLVYDSKPLNGTINILICFESIPILHEELIHGIIFLFHSNPNINKFDKSIKVLTILFLESRLIPLIVQIIDEISPINKKTIISYTFHQKDHQKEVREKITITNVDTIIAYVSTGSRGYKIIFEENNKVKEIEAGGRNASLIFFKEEMSKVGKDQFYKLNDWCIINVKYISSIQTYVKMSKQINHEKELFKITGDMECKKKEILEIMAKHP